MKMIILDKIFYIVLLTVFMISSVSVKTKSSFIELMGVVIAEDINYNLGNKLISPSSY